MAELADAHGSGPCESNFMQVQVLLPAPIKKQALACFFIGKSDSLSTCSKAQTKPVKQNFENLSKKRPPSRGHFAYRRDCFPARRPRRSFLPREVERLKATLLVRLQVLSPRRRKLRIACDALFMLTHNRASPLAPLLRLLREKARLFRLLACKRARDGFTALPPFRGMNTHAFLLPLLLPKKCTHFLGPRFATR